MNTTYDQLCDHQRQIALLAGVSALLAWDERAKLPPAGGPHRAEQLSFLAGWEHQQKTDPRVGEWLDELLTSDLATDPHSDHGSTIHQLKRSYDKLVKIPQTLVEELTKATVVGQQTWVTARQADDFDQFAPQLETIVRLTKERVAAIGSDGSTDSIYDVLLDDYEPAASTDAVAAALQALGAELAPLVQSIVDSRVSAPKEILRRNYPIQSQRALGTQAATAIGFDFSAGRLDETHHPFCTTLGPNDCRITTRYDEHFFSGAFFGTLHEAGHGIYEQGLRKELYGLPPGEAASMGIHESQSRLWENLVGRSRPFWEHFFPTAQSHFPDALADVSLDDFYFAVNDVHPSLIRVESDEATYNLHIIVRFELERALFEDDLTVRDLPEAWNEKYQHYLGIAPTNHSDGVLQDIHWSAGLFGYFATYSLGNLYAAQLFKTADQQIGNLPEHLKNGDFSSLRQWLRKSVHAAGRSRPADQLMREICGNPLSVEPLMNYLRRKLTPLYRLT